MARVPGFEWRILAHERKKISVRAEGYTGKQINLRSGDLPTPHEFDELVIDDWFHLEQMGGRDWWLGVGNGDDYWFVNIHIDPRGKAAVQLEKQ